MLQRFDVVSSVMAKKKQDNSHEPRIVNRKARHDYTITDSFEVGIVLHGSEVKSIREGRVSIAEGFARVEARGGRAPARKGVMGKKKNRGPVAQPKLELFLYDVEISPYSHSGGDAPANKRPRKLLAHKREIERLWEDTQAKGVTLVPLTLYFKEGRAKIELGIGQGKQRGDKREAIKERDADRQIRRALSKKM